MPTLRVFIHLSPKGRKGSGPTARENETVYHSAVATKTISIEKDAYDALVAARRHPEESFTSVIRREVGERGKASTILAAWDTLPYSPDPRDALTELAEIDASFRDGGRS